MSVNYYEILGVEITATKDEIKKAYRSLQMKYHPDRNLGNNEVILMTQKINEAYEVLGDEQKRAEYDAMRHHKHFNPFANNQGMEVPLDEIFKVFFSDMQEGSPFSFMSSGSGPKINMFHNGHRVNIQQSMNKPIPIIKSLQITLNQVLTGALVPLEIERWILENGQKVFEKEVIYVEIPQGIDDNEIIILREKGNCISETCKGDIKITLLINNNSEFKRSGLDLILEKTITLKQSLCGFKFEINYPNGKTYTMNNNKGNIVPPHYKKVYQGMGIKRGEHTGDMIIAFIVAFPEFLSVEQIDKLDEIL